MALATQSPANSASYSASLLDAAKANRRAYCIRNPLGLCEIAHAKSYVVGDMKGWTFFVDSWPKGKRFRAGDVLVFKYLPTAHNVVKVNHLGYRTCTVPRGSYITRTGNDHIRLVKGNNYFICNLPGHCVNAMRIAVYAS
ncbi:basic blue protein-like [Telopea speciosissima]|uniref:basic blue protein-like n=1 Tax=Telopea speciosissima TaxID=54955 RepID=UPI001CC3F352|nr:basic blue protein-like [Telopea speciosissima]